MVDMKYNGFEWNSSTLLRGITSLSQNKEGMLKMMINKYVTNLERHWL
jgi:hypothetical protein